MADNNDHISNTSKPVKAPTEKKKRKRPSKKVPTTVLQANNSGFMHLVQKLTGSAEELAAATPSPYSPFNQLEPMTTYQSTATPDVDTYPSYSSATAPYSNAPGSYSMGSYIQEQYQPYQDPAPSNYGGSNYGYGGGYGGTGGYGSGGYGGSGSQNYGDEDENSTYGYRGGSGDPSDRYNNNNNGSSPSSSRHEGSPNEFGNHNSSSGYYW